jgi:glycosyltransferase involved in cell wall biosynthesis
MKELVWIGHFRGQNGFATATREYFYSLLPFIPNLKLAPLEVLEETSEFQRYQAPLPLNEDNPNLVKVINHFPTTDPEAPIYLSICEYDHIPKEWVSILNQAKLIMTQSTFCRNIIANQINDKSKIHVIPYILPMEFKPEGEKMKYFDDTIFTFGSVFEWTLRKVPFITIQAFIQEFTKKEPVRLMLRTFHPYGGDCEQILRDFTLDPRILIIQKPIQDLSMFYRGLNAYISCTAGEGYGQTLAEAMACGTPTIASRHGGNLDFMNDSNSYLVDTHGWTNITEEYLLGMLKSKKFDLQAYTMGSNEQYQWKLPKINDLRRKMREVYDVWKQHKTDPKTLEAIKIRKDLNREIIGKKIYECLLKYID